MLKKMLSPAVLLLLAMAALNSAAAAEQLISCRLKGGTMVQLAAEACAVEGGTPITDAVPVVAPAAAIAATVQYSSDPKLAAAQRAVVELLNRPVVDKDLQKGNPEGVERAAKFDECRLLVDENMHVDYGNAISARMNFKIGSTIDLRNVSREAFGVLGKISSYGGGLKAHAVYFEEPKRSNGNSIAISVSELRKDGPRKLTLPGVVAFWDAPRDDLWMLDEYGYPKNNSSGLVATDTIRILFIVNTAEDATALKKALDDVHALCRP